MWESWSSEKQEEVFLKIEKKKTEHKFVDYNPLLALRNNASERPKRRQTMSFNDYYIKYGTSEERPPPRKVHVYNSTITGPGEVP